MYQESDGLSRSSETNIYNNEFQRLKSFPLTWPPNYFKKGDCARNGFYWDTTQLKCFSCNTTVNPTQSEEEDLAQKHADFCEFINRPDEARNEPIPQVLNYRWELHRIITFLRPSWEAPVDIYDLAKWGFYSTGIEDVGRCFVCRLEVRGWEAGDKGENEHRRWNPTCPFIENREVGNVPLGEECVLLTDRLAVVSNSGLTPALGSENLDLGNFLDLQQARHPQYAQRSDRLQTYGMWPVSIEQRPGNLADAGFYYTGRGDRVVCFYCGGGLKDWGDGDSPWIEHAAWFSYCEFVKIMKGQPFIINAQNLRTSRSFSEVQQFSPSNVNNIQAEQQQLEPVNQSARPSLQQLDLETGGEEATSSSEVDDYDKQSRMCKVCFMKELGIVFLPCGHMATCTDCAPQLMACPICRVKANAYVRAYLP